MNTTWGFRASGESCFRIFSSVGVDPRRFTTMGYGEAQPIAENDTVDGRQQTATPGRIWQLWANEKLKKAEKTAG